MIEGAYADCYELERFQERLDDAAPLLLTAAEELLRSLDRSSLDTSAARKLRFAVAKARGD